MTERRKWLASSALLGLGTLLMSTLAWPPRPRLVLNASASAPVGLYYVGPALGIGVGDLVIARLPEAARALAARRRYLPSNVPLVKRVAAGPGDTVCAIEEGIWVNGRRIAWRLSRDGAARVMPWWNGCRHLGNGAYFLVMVENTASFDGRYFGPSATEDIVGAAMPLWTR